MLTLILSLMNFQLAISFVRTEFIAINLVLQKMFALIFDMYRPIKNNRKNCQFMENLLESNQGRKPVIKNFPSYRKLLKII